MREQNTDQQQTAWIIRLTQRAAIDIHAGWAHFAQTADESVADAWQEGLEAEIAKLAWMPEALPVSEENGLFRETVRKLLYRRTRHTPAYRVLFVLRRPPNEALTVYILRIPHGAQAPMTAAEALESEIDEDAI